MNVNWLDVAGGVGTGVTGGTQDLRDMQNEALRRETMKNANQLSALQIEEAQRQAGLRKGIQRIRPAGAYQDMDPASVKMPTDGQGGSAGEALTTEEGAQGIQRATKPIVRTPWQVEREVGAAHMAAGDSEGAYQSTQRAESLVQKDYEKRVMDLIRKAPTLSLEDYAHAAADMKNADDTHINATTTKDANGQLNGVIYHQGSGGVARVPIKDHGTITDMLIGSLDPQNYMNTRKVQQGDVTAAAHATSAAASAQQAKTGHDRFMQEKLAGTFEAHAEQMKASAAASRAEAGLAPAKATELGSRANYNNAHAEQAKAIGVQLAAKATQFENKLPEHQKMYLDWQKSNAINLEKMAAQDPKFAPQAQAAVHQLFKTYSDLGLEGIDPYLVSKLPRPEAVVADMAAKKMKAKQVEETVAKVEQMYGKDYAAEVRALLPQSAQQGIPSPGVSAHTRRADQVRPADSAPAGEERYGLPGGGSSTTRPGNYVPIEEQ